MTDHSGNQDQNDLASLSIRRPVLVCVVSLLIILAGLAAMLGVEIRELPNVDRPTVTITATYSGASPETVDAEARLEQRERRRRVEHARARDGRVGREETVKALFFGVFYGFP